MGQMVSGITSIFGGFMAANSYLDSGEIQKTVQENNAKIDDMKAKDAVDRGLQAEFRGRSNTRKLIGSQRAAFGASGIDINEAGGVASNVSADTAKMSEMDMITVRTNAAREAWGFNVAAQEDRYKGTLAVWESEQAATGAVFQAGSSLYSKYGFSSDKPSSGGSSSGGTTYDAEQ